MGLLFDDNYIMEPMAKWNLLEADKIVASIEDSFANTLRNKKPDDFITVVLKGIIQKTFVTIREILILCLQGFPDGAMSLSRNLYE